MSNINELEKEIGLLREKVELLRALEELKAREPVKEYTPWPWPPVYPYGPYPSPWWGDLNPKSTWTGGGSMKTGTISVDGDILRMGNTPIFTGETTLYITGGG